MIFRKVYEGFTFIPVSHMDEVLKFALVGEVKNESKSSAEL